MRPGRSAPIASRAASIDPVKRRLLGKASTSAVACRERLIVAQVGYGGSMAVSHFINRLAAALATLTPIILAFISSTWFFRLATLYRSSKGRLAWSATLAGTFRRGGLDL